MRVDHFGAAWHRVLATPATPRTGILRRRRPELHVLKVVVPVFSARQRYLSGGRGSKVIVHATRGWQENAEEGNSTPQLTTRTPSKKKQIQFENKSKAQKRKWQDSEYREKVAACIRAKWQDKEYRDQVCSSLKGRAVWNKGKKFSKKICQSAKVAEKKQPIKKTESLVNRPKQERSQKTRELIRAARLGKRHTLATKRKMSVSHMGKTHSTETMELLSQKLRGIPKSKQHKARIAASQRKRIAARKALRAIEAAHSSAGPLFDTGNHSARRLFFGANTRDYSSLTGLKKKQTRAEVMQMYKSLLHEYRNLQEELSPWMTAFYENHSRRPTLRDAEATKIKWLIEKFKYHLVLREKLFIEIPGLREKIDSAQEDCAFDDNTASPNLGMELSDDGASASEKLSDRLAAASQYKKTHTGSRNGTRAENGAAGLHGNSSLLVPERVRKAMDAAQQYRRRQAQASAAVARAAAASAVSQSSQECVQGESKQMSEECAIDDQQLSEAQEKARAAVEALKEAKAEVENLYAVGSD